MGKTSQTSQLRAETLSIYLHGKARVPTVLPNPVCRRLGHPDTQHGECQQDQGTGKTVPPTQWPARIIRRQNPDHRRENILPSVSGNRNKGTTITQGKGVGDLLASFKQSHEGCGSLPEKASPADQACLLQG